MKWALSAAYFLTLKASVEKQILEPCHIKNDQENISLLGLEKRKLAQLWGCGNGVRELGTHGLVVGLFHGREM